MTITLDAEPRFVRSNEARRLRKAGRVPAIVYGAIAEPLAVSVDGRAFKSVLAQAGESRIVELSLQGKQMPTLVHALVHSAFNHHFEHVDFLAIDTSQKVRVDVPIIFVGVAPVEKVGVVTKVLHSIHVEALPVNLPHTITVDLGGLLDLESNIRIKDIATLEGVKFLHDADDVIVAVTPQAEDEQEVVVEEQVELQPATS